MIEEGYFGKVCWDRGILEKYVGESGSLGKYVERRVFRESMMGDGSKKVLLGRVFPESVNRRLCDPA